MPTHGNTIERDEGCEYRACYSILLAGPASCPTAQHSNSNTVPPTTLTPNSRQMGHIGALRHDQAGVDETSCLRGAKYEEQK